VHLSAQTHLSVEAHVVSANASDVVVIGLREGAGDRDWEKAENRAKSTKVRICETSKNTEPSIRESMPPKMSLHASIETFEMLKTGTTKLLTSTKEVPTHREFSTSSTGDKQHIHESLRGRLIFPI
jgi:hypothetical protein